MSKLLVQTTFDHFLLSEAVITTFNTFTIDGHLRKEFYSEDELESLQLKESHLSAWENIKPICFELIKGKKTPLHFKFVFQLSPSNTERLLQQTGLSLTPQDVNGLFINIKYDGNVLSCITGTSLNFFTLDKSLEQAWDSMIQRFLKQQEIIFDE
jgi:hypothetical protein